MADDIEEFTDNPSETQELTDWANEPKLSDLKQDYEDADSEHSSAVARIENWLDNLHVRGKAKVKTPKGKSKLVPKLIRKQAEWRYAALSEPFLSTEDVFDVSPVTFEDKEAAEQNQLVLNNQFNTKIDKVSFIDEYVRTVVDEGTVIVKIGWDFEEEEVEVEEPTYSFQPSLDPKIAQMHQRIHQEMQQDPSYLSRIDPGVAEAHKITMAQGVPIASIQTGTTIKTELQVTKNAPTLEVCHYKHVLVDPTCQGDLNNAKFIIHDFESSKSDLEKDGRYINLDKINVEGSNPLSQPDYADPENSNQSFQFKDNPRKKFVVHEYWGYWDIDGTGVTKPIVCSYVGDTIIRLEENPFPNGKLPFVSAQYLPVRKSIYGQPDGELLEENQKVLGATMRGMIDVLARSANGQVAHRKDALDITNRRKFDRGEDYEFNSGVDPRQAFHMHTYPELPASAQFMLQLQNADAESLTGVRPFAQSSTGNIGSETASGVKSAMDATSKREMGILRRLARGITEIGRFIIGMNAEFLEEEEVVRITNDEFVQVRRDDLSGNIDLKLSISTAEADEQKASELAFMLQTTGQTMGPEFSQIILADIAKLRKMPALAQKIESFQPQPDPMEQMRKQLEIQLLQAQIEETRSKAAENYAEAGLDQAKTRTEHSNADKTDLDFVEQESGTTHARDVDKITSQAEAQARTKIIEHGLKQREEAQKQTATN